MTFPHIVVLLLLLAGYHSSHAAETTAKTESPTKVILQLTPEPKQHCWQAREVGVVEFYHGGLAAPGGGDLTVLSADNTPLPHRILQAGPGTFLRVAFRCAPRNGITLTYGNGKPQATKHQETEHLSLALTPVNPGWAPPAGLLLTTWPLPKGASADSWTDMQTLLKTVQNTQPYGSKFVPAVYHGHHPFYPADAVFVSAYEGWLGCPADGNYVFATSSDDASFLLIDNKLVVAWPGGHGARWDAKYNKTVTLEKGVHQFAYYHVNFAGPTIACAAWKPPGGKKIVPIPKESFAPVIQYSASLLPHQRKDQQGYLLHVDNIGEAWVSGHQLLRYRFSIEHRINDSSGWDFGDGCVSDALTAGRTEHIYLTPGLRTVSWSGLKNRVFIHPASHRSVSKSLDNSAPYLRQIATYPFDKLNRDDLYTAIAVLRTDPAYAESTIRACKSALNQRDLPPKDLYQFASLAGDLLRSDAIGRHDEAVSLYRSAINRLEGGNRKAKAMLLREVGDTLFYFAKDLDAALNEYDKVVGRYADVLDHDIVRVTKIKIGDIYRQKGMGEKAREVYAEAAEMKLFDRTFAQDTVRKGALYKAADDFLARSETDAARKWIEILEWEYPLEKMDGYSSIARARIALTEKNETEALKQLTWFINASPQSSYAAEALYRKAELHATRGDSEAYKRTVETLNDAHPDSPYTAKVHELTVNNEAP